MSAKQTITRKDGIVYERKIKNTKNYNKNICVRITNEIDEKLRKYGKPGTILRELAIDFLKEKGE